MRSLAGIGIVGIGILVIFELGSKQQVGTSKSQWMVIIMTSLFVAFILATASVILALAIDTLSINVIA